MKVNSLEWARKDGASGLTQEDHCREELCGSFQSAAARCCYSSVCCRVNQIYSWSVSCWCQLFSLCLCGCCSFSRVLLEVVSDLQQKPPYLCETCCNFSFLELCSKVSDRYFKIKFVMVLSWTHVMMDDMLDVLSIIKSSSIKNT